MALAKYGGGIIQMSGSIAGDVHARNRFGNYIRPRTKPVNPKSDRQMNVRSILTELVERWTSTVTAAQRLAWGTYAAAIAMKNRLGETINLTGFNHYIRGNVATLICGGTEVDDGPTDLVLPGADDTFEATASEASQQLSITFDNTKDWANEDGGFLSVEMGQPQNPTRNFFNGPWRNAGHVDGDDTTPPTSPASIAAPFTLTEGQLVWVRAAIIRADGRLSSKFYSAVVTVAA